MAILVGIIENEISYSNCYGNQNDTIRNLIIIKEGSIDDLVIYANQKRQDAITGRLEFDELVKNYHLIKDYNEKKEIFCKKLEFEKYKNIMILEGMIV